MTLCFVWASSQIISIATVCLCASTVHSALYSAAFVTSGGCLQQHGPCSAGDSKLTIGITAARMKYTGVMERPFFTVSLRTQRGQLIEPAHNTLPALWDAKNNVLKAGDVLALSTPVRSLPDGERRVLAWHPSACMTGQSSCYFQLRNICCMLAGIGWAGGLFGSSTACFRQPGLVVQERCCAQAKAACCGAHSRQAVCGLTHSSLHC